MTSLDYFSISNGPAVAQHSDLFITYSLTSSFVLLCALPLVTYFKDSILWTFSCTGDSIHCIFFFYVTYIFNILYGLYIVWKELKQLHPQDQRFQQPKTIKPLVQISPPPDEFLTEVRGAVDNIDPDITNT